MLYTRIIFTYNALTPSISAQAPGTGPDGVDPLMSDPVTQGHPDDDFVQAPVVRATAAGGLFTTGSFTIAIDGVGGLSADQVSYNPSGSITATTVQDAIKALDAEKAMVGHMHPGLAPAGGATGQVLKKQSNDDFDMTWADDLQGGSGGAVDLVTSVYGRTGAIAAQNGDYSAAQIVNVPSGSIAAVSVQAAINEIDAEKTPISRQVATQHSLTGGGSLTADRTLGLVNDVAAPGASKYYGTDTSGTRGWQAMPSGGGAGAIAVERDNSEVLAAASRLNFTGSGVTIANAGGGEVTVTVPGPSAHTHPDLFAADADVGLVMSAESTVSGTWTPSVADAAIIRAATSANLQVNTPGAVSGSGEIKKTLQVRNAGSGTIILTFSGFGGYDGVEPPRSLVGGEVARFIIRTENSGTTWTISGDFNYVSWPQKATPDAADLLLIADGADGNKLKRIALGALPSGGSSTVLAANQYEAKRDDSSAREARTDKRSACFVAPISADGTFTVALWPDVPMRLSQVSARTSAGTCAIQVHKNGNAISGFASPLSLSTSVSAATSTETLAENDYLTLVVTASSALRGVAVTFKGTRTAN